MFGLLRFLLSLMVLIGHLFWLSDLGRYAVFGFFILSGYLMTLVMHKTYTYSINGSSRFFVNRFLRLYPGYWVACLLTIVLIITVGEANTRIMTSSLTLPETPGMILTNITMLSFGLYPNDALPRLSPATWALTTELFYYFLIAMGISRTKQRTICWLLLSFAYVLATILAGYGWHARYFALPAGSLPFAIGAFLFFLQQENWYPKWHQFLLNSPMLFTLFTINAVIGSLVQADERLLLAEIFIYINLVICTLLIYSIIRGKSIARVSEKMDKLLGGFAYPIYLVHLQIGVVASYIVYGQVQFLKHQFLPAVWMLTGILAIGFSLALMKLIDEPIAMIRERIKRKQPGHTHEGYDSIHVTLDAGLPAPRAD